MTPSNSHYQDLPEPSAHDVSAAAAGDRDAFRRIVERYQGMVYTMAYNMLGNHVDAEDAAQEVFLRLHRKLDGFAGRSSFTTWFFRLSMNAIVDYQRKWRRHAAPPDAPELAASPHDELLRRIGYETLLGALNELPPDYRTVVVMRDLYGMSYREISDALDRPLGTVKASVHRGRSSLRLRLRAAGAFDQGEEA
jgi:RNA polymerase sigma-70 factor, ECF subfamily